MYPQATSSEYHRAYHQANQQKRQDRRRARTARMRLFTQRVKSLGRCVDCGGRFHYAAMEFHHRDPAQKIRDVSKPQEFGSLARLKEEMRKCDLTCANCHRIRHALEREAAGTRHGG